MRSQQAPASFVVNTEKEVRGNLSKSDVTIIGVFNNEYTNMLETYMEAGAPFKF